MRIETGEHKGRLSPRGKFYLIISGLFVTWAIVILIHRVIHTLAPTPFTYAIRGYLIVPYVFLYPVSFALTWFLERSMKIHFKHRVLVWIPMACAGGLYLSLAVWFFIRSTIV